MSVHLIHCTRTMAKTNRKSTYRRHATRPCRCDLGTDQYHCCHPGEDNHSLSWTHAAWTRFELGKVPDGRSDSRQPTQPAMEMTIAAVGTLLWWESYAEKFWMSYPAVEIEVAWERALSVASMTCEGMAATAGPSQHTLHCHSREVSGLEPSSCRRAWSGIGKISGSIVRKVTKEETSLQGR
jgi:hypothetical protein